MFNFLTDIKGKVIGALIVVILGLGIYIGILHIGLWNKDRQINNVKQDLNTTKIELANIKSSLVQNAINYQNMLNEYKNKSPKVVTKYTTVYREIKDSNDTIEHKVFLYVKRMRDAEIDSNITK